MDVEKFSRYSAKSGTNSARGSPESDSPPRGGVWSLGYTAREYTRLEYHVSKVRKEETYKANINNSNEGYLQEDHFAQAYNSFRVTPQINPSHHHHHQIPSILPLSLTIAVNLTPNHNPVLAYQIAHCPRHEKKSGKNLFADCFPTL